MRLLLVLVIFAIAVKFTCSTSRNEFNYTRLIEQYYLVCGVDYVCNINRINLGLITPDLHYRNATKHCSDCYCDDACLSRGDCCPDIFFSLPGLNCVNTTVLNYIQDDILEPKPHYHLLVNSCPSEAAMNITAKCLGNVSTIQHLVSPPVTSYGFPVTYRNKHCALCNNVEETYFYDWALDIDCKIFADFNFLSTHEDIIHTGKKHQCRLRYTSPIILSAAPCDSELTLKKSWHIGSCNTTDTWHVYDPSIYEACNSHYEVPYRLFKNIFCYMCNPPLSNRRIPIDKCNTTRLWQPHDSGLEMSCELNPSSPYTVPFKNIFCFLCNRINQQNYTYLEAKTKNVTEVYNPKQNIYLYKFDIIFLRIEYLYDLYRTYRPESWTLKKVKDDMTHYNIHGNDINITSLVYSHFASFPYDTFCDRDILPLQYTLKSVDKCSCRDECLFPQLFVGDECCLDKALVTPMSCVSRKILWDSRFFRSNMFYELSANYDTFNLSFLFISGCEQAPTNSLLHDRCKIFEPSDLFSLLPVTLSLKYPNPTLVQYTNIDCLICRNVLPSYGNLYQEELKHILENDFSENMNIKTFDVFIKCPNILETGHNVLLYDVIRLAEHINCDVVIAPTKSSPRNCVSFLDQSVSKCNSTGMWSVSDPHVQWACENTTDQQLPTMVNGFKNYFCYMCNPIGVDQIVIDKCNVTGLWKSYSASVENACALFPRIHSKTLYKNVFCELCNLNSYSTPYVSTFGDGIYEPPDDDVVPPKFVYPTYRNMFSVATYEDEESHDIADNCTNKQVYDAKQDLCRNLTCFPGKFLRNRTCIPLFTFTSNLRYTVSMNLIGKLNIQGRHIELLTAIQDYFKIFIPQRLNISNILVDGFHLLSNISCDTLAGSEADTSDTNAVHVLSTNRGADNLEDRATEIVTDNTTDRMTDSMTDSTSNFVIEDMNDGNKEGINILMHISFLISDFVHRADTERTITALCTERHYIPVMEANRTIDIFTVHAEPSLESYITPVLIEQTHFTDRCFIKNTNQTFRAHQSYNAVHSSKLLLCEQLEFKKQEFTFQRLQMEARVTSIDKVLEFGQFHRLPHDMIRVCLDDVHELTVPSSSVAELSVKRDDLEVALGYVTFVCTVLSMLCLTLTFFVYCLCSQLRTVPGCINMFIIASLFLAQGTFQFGYMFYSVHQYCVAVGILTHLSWLILFAWMNISSFHMMRVFSGMEVANNVNKSSKMVLIWYSLFSFSIPIIIIVTTLVTVGVTSDWSSIGYGETSICFINNELAFYASFLAPVILVCLGNLIFFSITAVKIRRTPTSPRSTGSKRHFDIYVRLFFITGVTWLLVVIETLLPVTALSFITTVLNGCQGVYIFVSYVMNRRSFSMVRTQFATMSLRLSESTSTRNQHQH